VTQPPPPPSSSSAPVPGPGSQPRELVRSPATGFVIGLIAGGFSALLGIGGGLIMVPALVYLLRIREHRAVGTSLAVILPTALAAAFRYTQEAVLRDEPAIQMAVVLWLAVGGVIGALVGAIVANLLNARQLRQVFGLFVVAVGAWMLFGTVPAGTEYAATEAPTAPALTLIGIGVIVGMLSGLLGVGGGLVMVPVLVLLLTYPQRLAQGTSLAVIIPVSISGALMHMRRGNIVWPLVPWLCAGAVLGAWVVVGPVFELRQDVLRMIFGVFLVVVGLSMIVARRGKPQPARDEQQDEA
jgi:uncharacterized protein